LAQGSGAGDPPPAPPACQPVPLSDAPLAVAMPHQLWEVIGGGKAGGIVVRQGEDLQSEQLPERLGRGAVVSEEKLVGERLCFKKVSGDGPDKGWVSMKLKGVALLVAKEAPPVKKPPAPPPELSREQALNMQKELHDGFKQESFQQELKALKAKYPEGGRQFVVERSKLYSTVQHAVIPKYGYEANAKGIFLMGQALTTWSNQDPEIGLLGGQISVLLDPPPPPTPPAGADEFPPPPVVSWDDDWLPPLPEGQTMDWMNQYGMEGIANLRDVAGVDPGRRRKVGGGRLRRGLLFRTASWTVATEADVARLQDELGIKTYFDLRQAKDVEGVDGAIWDAYPPSPSGRHNGDLREAGCFRRLHFDFARCTAFRELSADERAGRLPKDDRRGQTNLWFQHELRKAFQEGFSASTLERHLAFLNACILFSNDDIVLAALKACTDPLNYPLAFGCMTGKDRTGLMSMLVLSALGASKEEIMEDYLLTNLSAAHNSHVIGRNYQAWEEEKKRKEAEMYAAWLEEEGRQNAANSPEEHSAEGQTQALALETSHATASQGPAQPALHAEEPLLEAAADAQGVMEQPQDAGAAHEPGHDGVEDDQCAKQPQDTGSIAGNEDNLRTAKVFRGVMEYTFHVLEKEAGGAASYLNSIGFGSEDIAKLREILVEPDVGDTA